MNNSINTQLIESLKAYQARGFTEEQTRSALQAAGWLDEEIDRARVESQVQFGEEDNSANAQATIALSNAQAEDTYDRLQRQTVLDSLAADYAPGIQARAYYSSKFYEDIGVGYWSTHILDLVAALIAIWLRMPALYILVSTGITLHVSYSFYKVLFWRRHRKTFQK